MSALNYDLELQTLKERSVDRLLAAEVFDLPAFDRLLAYLDGKAGRLREEYVVPKQVLACLREASSAIKSSAEYIPDARANRAVADQFDLLLDLIIMGESFGDRMPGVPRII